MRNRQVAPGTPWFVAAVTLGVVGLLCLGPLFVSSAGARVPLSDSILSVTANPLHLRASSAPATAVPSGGYGPHPGTLEIWEASSGGPETVDPSVCYYTVCDEPIANVYETLVGYNGSDDGPTASNFVPEVATCVPGSGQCSAQFGGSDLEWNNDSTGSPQYYTFEIDAGARFYDGAHGRSWPVYPSDVVFSFARTMAFADLQYEEQTSGWINTQDLVPAGSPEWDGGIHAPLNNTPQHVLGAFLVNDSAYCPTSLIVATNGCVTFNVTASDHGWPFFFELIADNMGASIQSCGWDTAQGASVPGFLGSNASDGDGPCLLPGNATGTSQPGFQNYLAATKPTGWDAFEEEANNWPADQPSVEWNEVGSGPYYVDNPISPAVGYTLAANPAYAAPVGCADQPGCMPLPGQYIPNVNVVWESGTVGDQSGLEQLSAGQADSAGFYSTDLPEVQSFSKDYSVITDVPSLTIGFFLFALTFNVTNEQTVDLTGQLNVPGDFFQNVALRQFLVHAYPYGTIDSTYDTVNGTAFGEGYGGAIPHSLGPYYSGGIDWPAGNPISNSTVVGNVSWWWEEANNATSAYYDPQLTSCTAANPCRWADFSNQGAATLDEEYDAWNGEVANLSGGSLEPYVVDLDGQGPCGLCSPPLQDFMPVYQFGWAPDYPDPSDYMAPMYYPNNSYTDPDAVSETLEAGANNATSCPNDYGAMSNLTFWAGLGEIPTVCQGAAYDTMVAWMNIAAYETNPYQRIVDYTLIEQIVNELALYVYDPQSLTAIDYAHWINPSSINTNPMYGGSNVQLWYGWGYVANSQGVTFLETGLPAGESWTVTLGESTANSSTPAVVFTGLRNGTYPFSIRSVAGFVSNRSAGFVSLLGRNISVPVMFQPPPRTEYSVDVLESGFPVPSNWTVTLGGFSIRSDEAEILFLEPNGTYSYSITPATGYSAEDSAGNLTVDGQSVDLTVNFTPDPAETYAITFEETGLPGGANWSVAFNGTYHSSTEASIVVLAPNGTYSYAVGVADGRSPTPSGGTLQVSGSDRTIPLTFEAVSSSNHGAVSGWWGGSTEGWLVLGFSIGLVGGLIGVARWVGSRGRSVKRGRRPGGSARPDREKLSPGSGQVSYADYWRPPK
jgi:hypothetical protein